MKFVVLVFRIVLVVAVTLPLHAQLGTPVGQAQKAKQKTPSTSQVVQSSPQAQATSGQAPATTPAPSAPKQSSVAPSSPCAPPASNAAPGSPDGNPSEPAGGNQAGGQGGQETPPPANTPQAATGQAAPQQGQPAPPQQPAGTQRSEASEGQANLAMAQYSQTRIKNSQCPSLEFLDGKTPIHPIVVQAYNAVQQRPLMDATNDLTDPANCAILIAACDVAFEVYQSDLKNPTPRAKVWKDAETAANNEINGAAPDLKPFVQRATAAVLGGIGDTPNEIKKNGIFDGLSSRCTYGSYGTGPTNQVYGYKSWGPTIGPGCTSQSVANFWNLDKGYAFAQSVRYLYGVTASSNTIQADLFTAAFSPGFLMTFSTAVTTGSSTTPTAGSSTTTPSSTGQTTDSPATAISKLETGGDFSLQGAFPVLRWDMSANHGLFLETMADPRGGFSVSGLGSQNTITQGTDFNLFYPIETYLQLASIQGATSDDATFFADARVGGQHLSTDLANKLGLGTNFFLGQFSFGVEFKQAVRVSFQGFVGPSGNYYTAGSTTPATTNVNGWHVVVDFMPSAATSKTNSN